MRRSLGMSLRDKTFSLFLAIASACVADKVYAVPDGLGVFEPAAAAWRFSDSPTAPSIDHTAAGFGLGNPDGTPVAGDWDGDGVDGVGIYAGTSFFNSNTAPNAATDNSVSVLGYGLNMPSPPDNGFAGDWDGDGTDSVGGLGGNTTFFLNVGTSAAPASQLIGYGLAADNPIWGIAGDWDGDGIDTIGFLDLDTETFYLADANPPTTNLFVGGIAGVAVTGTKIPVAGDWDGDGTDGLGLFEPATDTWYLSNSALTVPGDFDGDGTVDGADFLLWQRDPSVGSLTDWETNYGVTSGISSLSLDHTVTFGFGSSTQLPVVGLWVAPGPIGATVPEPATWTMLALGMATMLTRRRAVVLQPVS